MDVPNFGVEKVISADFCFYKCPYFSFFLCRNKPLPGEILLLPQLKEAIFGRWSFIKDLSTQSFNGLLPSDRLISMTTMIWEKKLWKGKTCCILKWIYTKYGFNHWLEQVRWIHPKVICFSDIFSSTKDIFLWNIFKLCSLSSWVFGKVNVIETTWFDTLWVVRNLCILA